MNLLSHKCKSFLAISSPSYFKQFDAVLLDFQKLLPSQHRETDNKCEILRKRLESDHAKILFCLENLGLLCAHEVCFTLIISLKTGNQLSFSASHSIVMTYEHHYSVNSMELCIVMHQLLIFYI